MANHSSSVEALREIEKIMLRSMEIITNEPNTDTKELLTALFLTITDITRPVIEKHDSVYDAEIVY